jgi:hypothetical protein
MPGGMQISPTLLGSSLASKRSALPFPKGGADRCSDMFTRFLLLVSCPGVWVLSRPALLPRTRHGSARALHGSCRSQPKLIGFDWPFSYNQLLITLHSDWAAFPPRALCSEVAQRTEGDGSRPAEYESCSPEGYPVISVEKGRSRCVIAERIRRKMQQLPPAFRTPHLGQREQE